MELEGLALLMCGSYSVPVSSWVGSLFGDLGGVSPWRELPETHISTILFPRPARPSLNLGVKASKNCSLPTSPAPSPA